MKRGFKYLYGPVPSWRLGRSLGIDPLSQEEKICNFDCMYCQVGLTRAHTVERKNYVPVEAIIDELSALPPAAIDYITFSGRGDPSLAKNLGAAIRAVKKIRKEPVAVLTNSALMADDGVRKDLALADLVVAKLDAWSAESLRDINRPAGGIEFDNIVAGIKKFKKEYTGRLALQMMFIEENKGHVLEYIRLAQLIGPDEIQINTPLRHSSVAPLSRDEIARIKECFVRACGGIKIVSVYDQRPKTTVKSFSDKDTLKRRGKIA
ncbi:MAG: radical SAM protein [Candidatus Omnitrophica bacterium]|nr:radical SAM protein [Candidatus Omnitrophota bacterium]